MACALIAAHRGGSGRAPLVWAAARVVGWTSVEYLLHRFLPQAVQPFHRWHGEHYVRPTALIASTTLLSATLSATLATLPAWWWLGGWPAKRIYHAARHHARLSSGPRWRWLAERRCWHVRNQASRDTGTTAAHYSVSGGSRDAVFGTGRNPQSA